MDIRDFQGLLGFKLIIPGLYVLSWIGMFLGPSLFPVVYQRYFIVLWLFLLFKMTYITYNMATVLYRTMKNLRGYKAPPRPDSNSLVERDELPAPVYCHRYYAWVIPSYKEDEDLLAQTLGWIASHSRARTNYMVFLAMEKHEDNSDLKAKRLIERFRGKFRVMDFTRHEIRQYEQKGKASNVSWCVEHLQPIFHRQRIDPNLVFLNIIDADSWAPPLYIDEVQKYYDQNIQKQYISILMPPQIFCRNYLDVPVFTRVYDHTHSLAHLSQMRSCVNLVFPLSNYTISYNLVKRIGFWDTCEDAIGEDFHTAQKAFWKTGGEVIMVPIYVPFNLVNVQVGTSYWADIEARFWQAERHAQGVSDVAYNFKQLIQTKLFCNLRAITLVYYIFECFAITATIPWVSYSFLYQTGILYKIVKPSPQLYTQDSLSLIMNIVSAITFVFWIIYEVYKRNSNKILYQKENESLLRILEYPLVVTLDIVFITVPAFVLAAFGSLFKSRQYRVAEKVIKKEGLHEEE